jgi:hypothetical protein
VGYILTYYRTDAFYVNLSRPTAQGRRQGTRRTTSSACRRATLSQAPSRSATARCLLWCPTTAAIASTPALWACSTSSWLSRSWQLLRHPFASVSQPNGAYRHGSPATCEQRKIVIYHLLMKYYANGGASRESIDQWYS